jgi:hypothetical protein
VLILAFTLSVDRELVVISAHSLTDMLENVHTLPIVYWPALFVQNTPNQPHQRIATGVTSTLTENHKL